MPKQVTHKIFITLGLLSSSSIQTDLSASEFSWSEDRWGIQSQVAEIRVEAIAMQEHFPEKSSDIFQQLDALQSATSPEAALRDLQETISGTIKENEASPKRLSKYIPAETCRVGVHREQYVGEKSGVYSDIKRRLEQQTMGPGIEDIRVNFRKYSQWLWFEPTYSHIMVYYTEYTTQTVSAARTETKDLSNLLRMFEAILRIVQRDQTRLEEEEKQRQEDKLEQEKEAAKKAEEDRRQAEIDRCGEDGHALYDLACEYERGTVRRRRYIRDETHAVKVFELAKAKNHGMAWLKLGEYHALGKGGKFQNESMAKISFRGGYALGQKIHNFAANTSIARLWNQGTASLRRLDAVRLEQEHIAEEARRQGDLEVERQQELARVERERLADEARERERHEREARALMEHTAAEVEGLYSTMDRYVTPPVENFSSAEIRRGGGRQQQRRRRREGEVDSSEIAIPKIATDVLADVSSLDWDQSEFESEKNRFETLMLFDYSDLSETEELECLSRTLQRIYNYQLRPSEKLKNELTTLGDLVTDASTPWRSKLAKVNVWIETKLAQSDVEVREGKTFKSAVVKDNSEKSELIERELWPQVIQVKRILNGTLGGVRTPVKEWGQEEISNWCRSFKARSKAKRWEDRLKAFAVVQRAVQLVHKKTPRTTQIFSVIANLKSLDESGRFLQISTGQGKTLITAMNAAVRALCGQLVDIASSSEELSRRDAKEQCAFYEALGLSCADVIAEDENEVIKGYESPVVYGTVHALSAHVLIQEFQGQARRSDRSFDVLFVDEVDSLTIDQINVFTQLSSPIAGMEALLPLLNKLLMQYKLMLEAGVSEQQVGSGLNEWLTSYAFSEEAKAEGILISERLYAFVEYQIPVWVKSVTRAMKEHHVDQDHIRHSNGSIRPVDYDQTGVVNTQQVYSDGIHQFLQLESQGYLTAESLLGSFMSPLTYIHRYGGNVFGVSGTLGDKQTRSFMAETYGKSMPEGVNPVDFIDVPTYQPSRRIDYPDQLVATSTQWELTTVSATLEETNRGRAVLVLCETVEDLKQLKGALSRHLSKDRIMSYARNDVEEDVLPEQMGVGDILLATNLAGRGTDLSVSDAVEAKGGLHVCMTFLPKTARVQQQNQGRTARQGKQGSSQLILFDPLVGINGVTASERIKTLNAERQARETKQLDYTRAYTIPEGQLNDVYFNKVQTFIQALRNGRDPENIPEEERAQLAELEEIWAQQYQLIRTYGEQVYHCQGQLLEMHLKAHDLRQKGEVADRPMQLLETVAAMSEVSVEKLHAEILERVWQQSGYNVESSKELLQELVHGSDSFFSIAAHAAGRSIVVLDQQGGERVFKVEGDKIPIVLGCLTGGKDAPAELVSKASRHLHDVMSDGHCLYHALIHQLMIQNHPFVRDELEEMPEVKALQDEAHLACIAQSDHVPLPNAWKEKSLSQRLRWVLTGTPDGDTHGGDLEIQVFVKTFKCVVTVTEDNKIEEGPVYYLNEGDVTTVPGRELSGQSKEKLSELPIYKLWLGQTTDDDKNVIGHHYQSVTQDPESQVLYPVLSSVFEVDPSYRGLKKRKTNALRPTHLQARYVKLSATSETAKAYVKKKIEEAEVINLSDYPSISIEELDHMNGLYNKAVEKYYANYFAAEKAYVMPVIKSFIDEAEGYFKAWKKRGQDTKGRQGFVLSTPRLLKLADSMSYARFVDHLTMTYGSDPSMAYAAMYGLAMKLAKYSELGVSKSKHVIEELLNIVQEQAMQARLGWMSIGASHQAMGTFEPGEGSETQSFTPLMMQIMGRMNLLNALQQNADSNIEKIRTCPDDHTIGRGKFEAFDLKALGVIEEDWGASRSNGIMGTYILTQDPPKPDFGDYVAMAMLGAFQGMLGTMLVMSGVGAMFGMNLIAQGIGDIVDAVWAGVSGEAVDWVSYWTKKAVSCLMMVVGAAAKSIQTGQEFATTFAKDYVGETMTQEIVNEAGKRTVEQLSAAEIGKEIGFTITKSVGASIAGKITSIGLSKLREAALGEFKDQIGRKSQEKVDALYAEKGFQIQVSRVMVFEAGTNKRWKVQQGVEQQMGQWIQGSSGVRDVIELLKTTMGTIGKSTDSEWLGITGEAVFAAHNLTVALTFMDEYIEQLRRVIKEAESGLKTALDGLSELSGEEKTTVKEFLKKLEAEGVLVGDQPYQVQLGTGKSGVTTDTEKAKETINSVASSMGITARSGGGSGGTAQGLTTWANMWVMAPGWVSQHGGIDSHAAWAAQLCSSGMMQELRGGIAGQVQGELQDLVKGAGEAVVDAMAEDWKGQRQWELENKAERTTEEQQELGQLQAEEWRRLETREEAEKKAGDPSLLTEEETTKLREYEARDSAAKQLQIDAMVANAEEQRQQDESATTQSYGMAQSSGAEAEELEQPKSPRARVTQKMLEMANESTELDVWTADDIIARYQLGNAGEELTGMAMGAVGSATVIAPSVMLPVLGRLAGAEIAGEAAREVLLQEGFSELDANMGAAVLNVALVGHMPVGGELPGAALKVPTHTQAESQTLIDRLKGAMEEVSHWRADPNAMRSGGLPLTRKVSVAEARDGVTTATVSDAPLNVSRAPKKVVTASGDKVSQMHVTGVEGCQSHHIVSWTNRHTKHHPLVKAAGYDLKHDTANLILLPEAEAAAKSTTFRSVHQGRHAMSYSEALAWEMKVAFEEGQSAGWSQGQYREALERVISEARTKLRSGETQLNKTTRESLGLPMKGVE